MWIIGLALSDGVLDLARACPGATMPCGSKSMEKDSLFRQPMKQVSDFEFNADVANVFDDMLNRSIPFYGAIQQMIADFVDHFYIEGTRVYDLGCSTGSMMVALAQQVPRIKEIVGVDTSSAMIEKCIQRKADLHGQLEPRLTFLQEDLRQAELEHASAIIMNYTLQFVRPLYREKVVRRLYDALEPGGVLLLSEKVLEKSTDLSRLFIEMYYRFKRRQGYSDLEISQKREMLENVLIPYQVDEQVELLNSCGFSNVEIFFKWHNFASFIAIKKA
jgi:tRNA (cmo5U34)-methyltransferase